MTISFIFVSEVLVTKHMGSERIKFPSLFFLYCSYFCGRVGIGRFFKTLRSQGTRRARKVPRELSWQHWENPQKKLAVERVNAAAESTGGVLCVGFSGLIAHLECSVSRKIIPQGVVESYLEKTIRLVDGTF